MHRHHQSYEPDAPMEPPATGDDGYSNYDADPYDINAEGDDSAVNGYAVSDYDDSADVGYEENVYAEGGDHAYDQGGYEADDYSDYDEELDNSHRFHVAMSVFNMISVLAGLVAILLLVALLVGLISWLKSDISHSFTLLQSTLQ